MKTPSRTAISHEAATRHLSPNKKKALELSADAEHETGRRRERLIREAKHKAG